MSHVPHGKTERFPGPVIYMKGKDFSFVYQFGYLQIQAYCVESLKVFLDILISGCSRPNIMKQTDVSILLIYKKDKGTFWSRICTRG